MREERSARRAHVGTVRLQVEQADPSGKMVFEAEDVGKSFEGQVVVRGFSARIMRGDRVGVIGSNGAGKTTLLRMLLGELAPDQGEVRHGANVQIAYYDQQREQLDPERTVFDTIGDGNEVVTVAGCPRHVNGYLRDFLFPPERARSPVKALSGGERNRLLLARLFTRPANVLVLDEPTNDLDLETLELLEAQLAEWPGTLLLVSHDRVFLDNVVTSTLVFEGDGRIGEFVGGYEDWMRARRATAEAPAKAVGQAAKCAAAASTDPSPAPGTPRAPVRKRLSYIDQREFERLPARIETLEAEQQRLHDAVSSPDFYKEPPDAIKATLARLEQLQLDLVRTYARWDELDSRTSG
jgi:ATP-binding cassette subfamily F protein uup